MSDVDLLIELLCICNFKPWDDQIKVGMIKAKLERQLGVPTDE